MNYNRATILIRMKDILDSMKLTENSAQFNEQTGLIGSGLGLDSIEILQLVAAIEEKFELTIDDDELLPEHFRTVGNLITFIERHYFK